MKNYLESFNYIWSWVDGDVDTICEKEIKDVQKALKALNIIKEKICFVRNDVGMICDKSNIHYQIVINQLTQQEYDLLKGILND